MHDPQTFNPSTLALAPACETFDDLTGIAKRAVLAARDLARAIAAVSRISEREAHERVERIEGDPRLREAFVTVSEQIGESAFVTNVEFNLVGDVVVTVAPMSALEPKGPKQRGYYDVQRMRRNVASFELQRAFHRAFRTALPFVVELGERDAFFMPKILLDMYGPARP